MFLWRNLDPRALAVVLDWMAARRPAAGAAQIRPVPAQPEPGAKSDPSASRAGPPR